MANDEPQLFDENGNIRPEADFLSRLAELAQPAEEYAQLGEQARTMRSQAEQFTPREMTLGQIASDRGNIPLPPDSAGKQRFDALSGQAQQLEQQAMGLRGPAYDNYQTAEQLAGMSDADLAPYMSNDQTGYIDAAPQQPMAPQPDPLMDPASAAAQIPTGTGSDLGSAKGESSPALDEYNRQWQTMQLQQSYMQQLKDGNVVQAQQNMQNLAELYADAEADVRNLRIDPRRWEKETPAFTKALLLIGAGAFGYITKGRGPNPLLEIIDRAIQTDVDAQMKNMEMAFKKGQLKVNRELGMQQARLALTTALQQRAFHVFETLNQNMKLGMEQQKYQAIMQKLAIDQQKGLMELAALKGMGQEVNQKWNDPRIEESTRDAASGITSLSSWMDELTALDGGRKTREAAIYLDKLPFVYTQTGDLNKRLDAAGSQLAKQILGYQISDIEGKNFGAFIPKPDDPRPMQALKSAALGGAHLIKLRESLEAASPADRQRLLGRYQRAEEAYTQLINRPDISKHLKDPKVKEKLRSMSAAIAATPPAK